jgi:hypothetical protein
MVVPILAPINTLMASVKVNKPAFEKLTTIKVVADEDWMTEVIKKPVVIPKNLLDVMVAKIDLILSPASFKSASLITFIPNKKTPKAPINCSISVKPYCIYNYLIKVNYVLI